MSGTLARRARDAGHAVTIVTRGEKPIPAGVAALKADRHAADFAAVVRPAADGWDLAVDCIGYTPEDAKQDLGVIAPNTDHFVFVSTDFVYDPAKRSYPQGEDAEAYLSAGYGGNKRLAELEFENQSKINAWTVVRPCHIYGPGSKLGCLPFHGRDPDLIAKLKAGTPLRLAAGGLFLQQPIHARDLADTILSLAGRDSARRAVLNTSGSHMILSSRYYEIIAEALGVKSRIEEVSAEAVLAEKPELASFLCHRIYTLDRLKAVGAHMPSTRMEDGLQEHVQSIVDTAG